MKHFRLFTLIAVVLVAGLGNAQPGRANLAATAAASTPPDGPPFPISIDVTVENRGQTESLPGNLELVTKDAPRAEAASTGVVAFSFDGQQFHLSNLRDAAAASASNDAEKARLTKLVADLTKSVATLEGRLNNPGYADKAPPHMVQQSRDQLAKAKAELATAQATLGTLA